MNPNTPKDRETLVEAAAPVIKEEQREKAADTAYATLVEDATPAIKEAPEETLAEDDASTIKEAPEAQSISGVQENGDLPKETEPVIGIVADCTRLNLREEPSSDGKVLSVLSVLAEVTVDMDGSTDEFYKVCTDRGIQGFCMKQYVSIRH